MRSLVLKPFLTLLVAVGCALGTSRAGAAPEPSPSEISVARRLFEEGKAAEDAGRYREAADKFRRATAIKDTPGMRFHLAHCEEAQGALVEALIEYDRARELLDSGVKAADVEKLLPAAREQVRAKVALLTVRLPQDVKNVSVELDGKALSASVVGVPLPINPGKHQLNAVAVGRTPFATQIELGTGEVRQLAVELPVATTLQPSAGLQAPAPVAAVTPPPAARVTDSSVPTRTIVLVGEASLFAAALTTGIVFTLAKSSAVDRYRSANDAVLEEVGGSDPAGTACSVPRRGCAELELARQDRDRAQVLSTVGFVAAGVSAAAFGITLALWQGQQAPAEVRASAGPGRLALSVSGHF